MSTCTPCGQSCIVAKMFVRFQEYEHNFHAKHDSRNTSVAKTGCRDPTQRTRHRSLQTIVHALGSKFDVQRSHNNIEILSTMPRRTTRSPAGTKCRHQEVLPMELGMCNNSSALSARCPKTLKSAEWNTSSHQIGPPTHHHSPR